MSTFRPKKTTFILTICFFYSALAYCISREQTALLFSSYFVTGALTYFLIPSLSLKQLLFWGSAFRLIFLLATPALSQDFYRFIWDANVQLLGISPYHFSPNELIEKNPNLFHEATFLWQKMGTLSAMHYSNYPPVNQWFFVICVALGKSTFVSLLLFRCIIILADIGIFLIAQKILKHLNQNPQKIAFYFLNPLVIIELTGNLHWEGVMIFFFLLGLFFLLKNKNITLTATFFALGIATKLIPILLMPQLKHLLQQKKYFLLGGSTFVITLLFCLPFFYETPINHYLKTIQLWFNRFEFNASIYYIIREIGYHTHGYNIIRKWGKIYPYLIIAIILIFSFVKKNDTPKKMFTAMLFCLSTYFFIATTIHPWYITFLIALSIFTKYKFPLLWGALVFMSYATYNHPQFKETISLLWIQYVAVYGMLFYEIFSCKNKKLNLKKSHIFAK